MKINVIKILLRLVMSIARFVLHVCVRAASTLAASDEPASADDPIRSAMCGGVLNYRTGRLDDGNDPYGWYERN